MESVTNSEATNKMISNMISLALKKEVSWALLASFLNEMSSTIEKSKQVITILLNELENMNSNTAEPLLKQREGEISIVSATENNLENKDNPVQGAQRKIIQLQYCNCMIFLCAPCITRIQANYN